MTYPRSGLINIGVGMLELQIAMEGRYAYCVRTMQVIVH